ncbi:bumetanide-sensitive sodium-(potassium)-chloride cotransporter isoform X2 [Scaptodrosophila lebanonensis]|uniref:Bumetanide-sensitive sodium-(Potassium)-chloride cotransporter isoform X2 n=1 Tax=Drosophila lebanonensis TaxID=7225 RepID=A0A6J2T978_DROLE|nr:bumetanide-sensitive sodium-(potassium)-chloride cotransporter isoform X2 [Scaptodrosophila lebanonensis]
MSEATSFEMGSVDRPPNRFQVNPVNHHKNKTDNNGSRRSHDGDGGGGGTGGGGAESDAPHEVYRRLVNSDGEPLEDDTFDATQVLKKQQPRIQRQSIKSSFRDKDKPSRFKDLQTTTRFQVEPQNVDTDDSNDSQEERELLDNEYDTKYGKSFRHFTREALPRLDNYRNMMSIQAAYRPTLDELHNATLVRKNTHSLTRNQDLESGIMNGMLKFGWIKGVLVRCLLNIWGVMLFLRLSWVVGQAGIVEGFLLILTTTVVTTITALSMSAISTNGVIKGGGTYYMISRSLGPEFGGSIGLIFSLANAVACAMYVVGFCESMRDLMRTFGGKIIDGGIMDVRIIGSVTILLLLIIVVVGMEWEAKAQIGLLVILLAAIADFIIGSFIGPKSDLELAKGFLGYNAMIFKQNMFADYRLDDDVHHDFFSVFAIFFPAATGILAGANISGDLKDPQKSIPKGTILAIIITTGTYLLMVLICGGTVARDATGNITDVVNGSFAFLDCLPGECDYGLHNSFQVIELVSGFGPLIYAGCFAATLSSALASLVSAPKVFQALCKDELYPKIVWFAKGFGKNNEPVRGYVLTFVIAVAFILIGELNLIAPLISNFFLAAYMLINFSTFHASLAKPVGWRPTFKYYNMWLSLVGAALCVAVMFLISWGTALITFGVVLALYLIVAYRKPDVNWGSTTQAQTYKNALMSVQQLNNVEEHVKNYRPQILVLSGLPNTRPVLVDFAYMLTKNLSLLVCGHVLRGSSSTTQKYRNYLHDRASSWFRKHRVKGFYALVDGEDFEAGTRALMQASGIGKLKPNIILMGYKADWQTCEHKELVQYFNVMHKALDMYLSVAILRIPSGLDCAQLLGDECSSVQRTLVEVPRTLQPNESSGDLQTVERSAQNGLSGSMDSLSRNVSQASSTSDLSFIASTQTKDVSGLPDPQEAKTANVLPNTLRKSKQKHDDPTSLYKGPGGVELSKDVLADLTQFTRKRSHAVIDVWWLYDDGGLTLLLPYIISTRRTWQSCKLRVYALANKKAELEFEQRSMASLLSKFRIDYSDLTLIPDITKKPQETSTQFFNELIKDFVVSDKENGLSTKLPNNVTEEEALISDDDLLAVQDKTNRYLRLREYLREQSTKSDLVVMTLPMPRKNIVTAPLYMAWLESLSRDMPPFLFVRGNQTSVLTFYS